MFRRKRQPSPVGPPTFRAPAPPAPEPQVDVTKILLVRADHAFTTDAGADMSFSGYDFFDSEGTPRDVGHGEAATEVDPGIWIMRLAGMRHNLPTHRAREIEPLSVVVLRSEPSNPVDPNAIAVHLPDGMRAGYVPAAAARDLAPILRAAGTDHINAVVLGVYSVGSLPVGVRVMVFDRNISFTVRDPD